jgi:hypothetical protein
MKPSAVNRTEKRKAGLGRCLVFDGILLIGGPFALVMQLTGFLLQEEGFVQYFSSARTWTKFFFHAMLFGLIIGSMICRRKRAPAGHTGTEPN